MRVLVLDTNLSYANPTARVLLESLAREVDVLFGGIGYALDTSSLSALERIYGRIDVILGQTWMFGEPGVGQYGPFVPRDLRDHAAPKVLNLLQVDPYAVPEYIYRTCIKPSDAVLSTVASTQFMDPNMRAASGRESWLDPDLFLVGRPDLVDERWVLLPHCISESEFVSAGSVAKRWDAIVPGADYHFRRAARERLKCAAGVSLASLEGPLQRALYWATSYYRAQKYIDLTPWFNRRFRERIAASRVGVTCDASIGYAIRKFFEIPAFGTLLAARFFPQMQALGFQDGVNCFAIEDGKLDRLEEIVAFAKSDGVVARRVTSAGQDMVRELHVASVRAQQLREFLEALCAGRLGSVRWRDGRPLVTAPSFSAIGPNAP